MSITLADGSLPSEELQLLFKEAAKNRHQIGIQRSHPEVQVRVEDPTGLEFPLVLAPFTSEQYRLVFLSLEGYESLAEHHRYGSPICEVCPGVPEPEYSEGDLEDLRRSAHRADLLAVLAM